MPEVLESVVRRIPQWGPTLTIVAKIGVDLGMQSVSHRRVPKHIQFVQGYTPGRALPECLHPVRKQIRFVRVVGRKVEPVDTMLTIQLIDMMLMIELIDMTLMIELIDMTLMIEQVDMTLMIEQVDMMLMAHLPVELVDRMMMIQLEPVDKRDQPVLARCNRYRSQWAVG